MILGSLLKKYFYSLSVIVLIYSVLVLGVNSAIAGTAASTTTSNAPSLFPLTPSTGVPLIPAPLPTVAGAAAPFVPNVPLFPSTPPMQPSFLPIVPPVTGSIPLVPLQAPLITNQPVILPPLFNTQSFVPGTIPPPASFAAAPPPTIVPSPVSGNIYGPSAAPTPVGIAVPIPISPSVAQPIVVSLGTSAEKTASQAAAPSQTLPPPTPIVVIDPDSLTQERIHPKSKMPEPTKVIEGDQKSSVASPLLYENKVLSFVEAPPCPVVPPSLSSIPVQAPMQRQSPTQAAGNQKEKSEEKEEMEEKPKASKKKGKGKKAGKKKAGKKKAGGKKKKK